jgi:integrase/recombinase XerD
MSSLPWLIRNCLGLGIAAGGVLDEIEEVGEGDGRRHVGYRPEDGSIYVPAFVPALRRQPAEEAVLPAVAAQRLELRHFFCGGAAALVGAFRRFWFRRALVSRAVRARASEVGLVVARRSHIGFFLQWCRERGLAEPADITRPVLERYQRHLFHYRKKNGEPLSFRSQHSRLVPLRVWFRWMARENHILHNPASEIELPRLGRALPKNILSAQEMELVLAQPDIHDAIGLRDRAVLEVLYSTGLRRLEIINLKLYDLQLDRELLLVRQGKGNKDRYVPIGQRAIAWLEKYVREARPQFAAEPDDMTVFLTAQGEPISRDHLTWTVRTHIVAANIGKVGACHLLRHTMATLMHENGADIRFVQQMLGHEDIKTTQIYTQVAIRTLQQIHAATHPAAFPDRKDAPALPHQRCSPKEGTDRERLLESLVPKTEQD